MSVQFRFDAIGTRWQIDVPGTVRDPSQLEAAILSRIERFDRAYSRFREDSLVTRISRTPGEYSLPDDARELLDLYRRLYDVTGGLVTPLVGALMEDAGYDRTYSLQPKEMMRAVPSWDDAMEYRDGVLVMRVPTMLDFGAAGKGYLIDLVGELLKANGITSYTIDAGGDILQRGGQSLTVALEDPENFELAIGTTTIKNGSICASAVSRRQWGAFHHVMDPHTKKSTTGVRAVWVKTGTAMEADGVATALFFVPPEQVATAFSFEYTVMYDDRSVKQSTGFGGELFTA